MKKNLLFVLLGTVILFTACGNTTNMEEPDSVSTTVTPVESVIAYGIHGGVVFDWKDPESSSLSSIKIKRKEKIVSFNPGVNTYTWNNLTDNQPYTFTIYAVDVDGRQTAGTIVTVVPTIKPVALRVMSYFLSNTNTVEENSLHLAYTIDGLNWTAFNNSKSVYQLSDIGGNRIRDPYIYKKQDGTYVYIATDWTLYGTDGAVSTSYWNNPSSYLIFADSTDLVHFTNLRRVRMVPDSVMEKRAANGFGEMYCWAPEVIYDDTRASGKYGVIWSGKGNIDGSANTQEYTYVNYTDDFDTFTDMVEYFNAGYNQIDADIIGDGNGKYYLYFKEEINHWGIRCASADSLAPGSFNGNFINGSENINKYFGTYSQAEGPFIFKPYDDKNLWYLYADCYQQSTFGLWTTTDLSADWSKWTEISSSDYSIPIGARHASTVSVTNDELVKILSAYGK